MQVENRAILEGNGASKRFYSSMEHYLLGVRGARWKKVRLAMIHVFIDDSGTDPGQRVAIASGLIVEPRRIIALDKEVTALSEKEGFLGERGFPAFHTSECVAGNPKSLFAGWDEEKKSWVCSEMRAIAKKYGVNACSIAIDRDLYDELVPLDSAIREGGGRFHYTWAVRELVKNLESWSAAQSHQMPLEYVFDWMGKEKRNPAKEEIEAVMAEAEESKPGFYAGQYGFRCREKTPGLQCADILAWTCYRFALWKLMEAPLRPIAEEGFADFSNYSPGGAKWLLAIVQTRQQLQEWIKAQRVL
jgi:hypothetical protein